MEDYTIELPSHEELEAVTGRIREAGLRLERRWRLGRSRSFGYLDPVGCCLI